MSQIVKELPVPESPIRFTLSTPITILVYHNVLYLVKILIYVSVAKSYMLDFTLFLL